MLEKPPLGVIPQKLWREHRMLELGRAIYEYLNAGFFENSNIKLWTDELSIMLSESISPKKKEPLSDEEIACYECAEKNGFLKQDADKCIEGSVGCVDCPFYLT